MIELTLSPNFGKKQIAKNYYDQKLKFFEKLHISVKYGKIDGICSRFGLKVD